MPDTASDNDLDDNNFDASDVMRLVTKLTSVNKFLARMETRMTRIDTVLTPQPPPIHPDVLAQLVTARDKAAAVSSIAVRIIERGQV
jgi:hypothetical protein